jgi:hypothetical protein
VRERRREAPRARSVARARCFEGTRFDEGVPGVARDEARHPLLTCESLNLKKRTWVKATTVPGLSARALSVDGSACAIDRENRVVCWGFIAQAAQFPACAIAK